MQTRALATALLGAGYTVVVCFYYECDPTMVRAFEEVGARVVPLGLSRDAKARNIWRLPKLAWELARFIRLEKPDYVHVQYMAPGLPPLLVAKLMRVPHVLATVHTPASVYGKRLCFIRSVVRRLCDAFLCVSPAAEASFFGDHAVFDEKLIERGRRHFAIPNGIDLQRIDALRASTDTVALRQSLGLDECVVVGMVSRLSREKGPHYLIEAMAGVTRAVPTVRLLIVGDGTEFQSLVDQARQLQIEDRIVWAGRLPGDEALRYLSTMDVVVVPSEWEGFGLSAAEAMAMHKPVVASDVAGLRDVVEDGVSGLRVPVGDVVALRKAIIALVRDAALRKRLGDAGRRRVEERFPMTVFADRHVHLYRALSGRGDEGRTAPPRDSAPVAAHESGR